MRYLLFSIFFIRRIISVQHKGRYGARLICLCFLAISLSLLSCSSSVNKASIELDVKAKQFSSIQGKALVYVVRGYQLDPVKTTAVALMMDGKFIGGLETGSYAVVDVFPGKHSFSITYNTEHRSREPFEVEVAAGGIYFLKVKYHLITLGLMPRPYLIRISDKEGKGLVKKYKLVETL